MSSKRLVDIVPSLNKENKIIVTELLNFMKEQNDDVVQGALFQIVYTTKIVLLIFGSIGNL
jgi:phage terminase large subunit-like protein